MKQSTEPARVDLDLLDSFRAEIGSKVPHVESKGTGIENPTPLADLTDAFTQCALSEYGIAVARKDLKVFGKFDSQVFGGSVKVRPAVRIVEDAIETGKLKRGQTVFEATSGNFGLALGLLQRLGIRVVALVSRKLQEGVLKELGRSGVKTIDLDVEICPAPGLKIDQNILVARGVASNVRQQLTDLGFDAAPFDANRAEIENLLAGQDVINLAKLLAKAYGGFCPEQYDNRLNPEAHEKVTGPEIEAQLRAAGYSLGEFRVVCAFGTGGTSMGLSAYIERKYGKKSVHVIFPLSNQDVAGIRTKQNASGLALYDWTRYAGQHEVDFEAARRVLRYFTQKGFDIGESSALALYACIQLLNFGVGNKFVVMIADGVSKYAQALETVSVAPKRAEVNLEEAIQSSADYAEVLWTHGMFTPTDAGIELIASSLGVGADKVKVARVRDVQALISRGEIPAGVQEMLPGNRRKILVVCMAGNTSLRAAQVLAKKGIEAESLTGGITALSQKKGKQPAELVRVARE